MKSCFPDTVFKVMARSPLLPASWSPTASESTFPAPGVEAPGFLPGAICLATIARFFLEHPQWSRQFEPRVISCKAPGVRLAEDLFSVWMELGLRADTRYDAFVEVVRHLQSSMLHLTESLRS